MEKRSLELKFLLFWNEESHAFPKITRECLLLKVGIVPSNGGKHIWSNPALSCYETKVQIEESHSIRDIVEHVLALNLYIISEELTTSYLICTKVNGYSLSLSKQ